MPTDIDELIARVRELHPDALIQQLTVSHKADDDGLWFFTLPSCKNDIQVESSSRNLPFLIEQSQPNTSSPAIHSSSLDEAVGIVSAYLSGLRGGSRLPGPNSRELPEMECAKLISLLDRVVEKNDLSQNFIRHVESEFASLLNYDERFEDFANALALFTGRSEELDSFKKECRVAIAILKQLRPDI